MADNIFQLVVREGPQPGLVFTLDLEKIILGRDPLSDIVLNDPEVSRHHATLNLLEDGFALHDLASTNGTFVDDMQLGEKPVNLKPGQTIRLGSHVRLLYRMAPSVDPLATMVAPQSPDEE